MVNTGGIGVRENGGQEMAVREISRMEEVKMKRTWARAKFERSVFWLRHYIFGKEYAEWFDPFNTWNRGYTARVEYENEEKT